MERHIVGHCQVLSRKLEDLDFEGKRSVFGAFCLKVDPTREDISITVVVDPVFLTIEQTLGCLSNSKYSFVIVELEEVVVQKRPRVVEFVPVDRGGDL